MKTRHRPPSQSLRLALLCWVALMMAPTLASAGGPRKARSVATQLGMTFTSPPGICRQAREPLLLAGFAVSYDFLPAPAPGKRGDTELQALTNELFDIASVAMTESGLKLTDGRSHVQALGGALIHACPGGDRACTSPGADLPQRLLGLGQGDAATARRDLASKTGASWEASLMLSFDHCDPASPDAICLPALADRRDFLGSPAVDFFARPLVQPRAPWLRRLRQFPRFRMGDCGALSDEACGGVNVMTRPIGVHDPAWREAGIAVSGGSPEDQMRGLTDAVIRVGVRALLSGCGQPDAADLREP